MAFLRVDCGLVKSVPLEAGRQGLGQPGTGTTSCDISTKGWDSSKYVVCIGRQGQGTCLMADLHEGLSF